MKPQFCEEIFSQIIDPQNTTVYCCQLKKLNQHGTELGKAKLHVIDSKTNLQTFIQAVVCVQFIVEN